MSDGDPAAADIGVHTHVASSNWSIGPLLSRGCLLPPAWGDATELRFFDEEWRQELPVARGPLPLDWCDEIRGGRRNAFPIAVRVSERPEAVAGGLVLDQVEALVFPTDDDLSMMLDSPFADFDLRSLDLELVVDATVFEGSGKGRQPTKAELLAPDPDALRLADSTAAMRATIPHVLVGSPDWIRTLQSLWRWPYRSPGGGHRFMDTCLRGVLGKEDRNPDEDLGVHLLGRSSHLLVRRFGAKGGWPAGEILDAIEEDLAKEELSETDKRILAAWVEKCREVVRGAGEVPDLSDSKGVPFRALMYLLMRGGDPETVFHSDRNGGIEVGREVRAIATVLAAARTGLRALPHELKTPAAADATGHWMAVLGRSIMLDLERARAEVRLLATLGSGDGLSSTWKIEADGVEVFEVPVFLEPALRQVIEAAGTLGLRVLDFGSESTILEGGAGETEHRIRIAAADSAADGNSSIAVYVVVRDLAPKRRGANPWPSSRAKKLTKNQLFGLLELNADPRKPWSVALSEEDQAVVLSDRLPVTADREETVSRLSRIVGEAEDLASSLSRDWGDS